MGDEWKEYRLGDIADWSSGGTPSKSNEDFWGGNIPWISASSMDGNRYFDSKLRVTDLGLKSGTRLAPAGSILLLGRGSILHQKIRVGIAERDVSFNQDVKALKVKQAILEPWYLLFWFMSKERELLGLVENTGIGAGKLDTKILQDLIVDIPPYEERKHILLFAKALDDKIELNRQMNATLESMAQALFKSWFVDFDPVIDNALAAGNPIPEPLHARAETRKALGDKRKPLPEAIQKQFPSSFVFSEEMGWIPERWSPLSLSEAIDINPRVTLKKGAVAKFVDMKALPTSGYAIAEVAEKEYAGGAKFENGDVLLARITPCLENGKTGVVDFLGVNEPGFGSTEFIVLRARGEVRTPFIAALARDEVFRQHCITNMVGTSGRQRVHNSCFDSYCVCLPNVASILESYHEICSTNFKKITSLKNESSALTKLRDVLLPKLLSGELRIPDAENIVQEAL